jgi:lipopolysaccharide export LptBFGC system permease protein LptF
VASWQRGESHAYFDSKDWEVPMPDDLIKNKYRRPRDMTWQQMYEFQDHLRGQLQENQEAIDVAQGMIDRGPLTPALGQHMDNLRKQRKLIHSRMREITAEQHMRPALALGCLFFVLVGCPVGIWFSRSDYLSSFITCFLPIVFIYYPLLLCGTGMAKDGKFDTMLTVWAADAVMALVGIVLFWRLMKN